MPCPWSSRLGCSRASATDAAVAGNALPSPTSSQDVEHWREIRRFNLRKMRKQVRYVVLLMAVIEALRVGPIEMVFAGKHGYPAPSENDFGIAYTMGYVFAWLYTCLFMIIWVPAFGWWVPKLFPSTTEDPSKPSSLRKVTCILTKLNMILLPMSIGIALITYAYYVLHTFVYVDTRPFGSKKFPKNTRKNWAVRAFMLLGIAMSTGLGYGAFQILADLDLAHVKTLEYAVIVIPVQINMGIFWGSVMQYKIEKRIARKQAQALEFAKAEEGYPEEKADLLEV